MEIKRSDMKEILHRLYRNLGLYEFKSPAKDASIYSVANSLIILQTLY